MKKTTTFIFTIISLFLIFSNSSCKEKEVKPISKEKDKVIEDSPVIIWNLSFFFTDSSGNNLVPFDLPDTPFLNPDDFFVVSDSASKLFYYKYFNYQIDSFGHIFSFGERLDLIRFSSQYQIDLTYKVKVCFANECDTVISRIYSLEEETKYFSNTGKRPYYTKWVLWNEDTIFTESYSTIPIVIK